MNSISENVCLFQLVQLDCCDFNPFQNNYCSARPP